MEEHLRTKNKDLETKRDKEKTSFPQTELPEVDDSKLEVVKENTQIDDIFRQPFQVYSLQNVQVYSLIKLETANAVMMGNQDTLSLGEVKKVIVLFFKKMKNDLMQMNLEDRWYFRI